MTSMKVAARYGGALEIDACRACRAYWFDGTESLALAPGAVIDLFKTIHEAGGTAASRPLDDGRCPRCSATLKRVHNRARNTPFSDLRCPTGHGRWVGFYDFLRERDFVRVPPPAQLEALRRQVKSVQCAGCGAPVDLVASASCGHCGAPVMVLDADRVAAALSELEVREARRTTVDPQLAAKMIMDQLDVDRRFMQPVRGVAPGGAPHAARLVGDSLAGLLDLFVAM
jgi:hypothetical protein